MQYIIYNNKLAIMITYQMNILCDVKSTRHKFTMFMLQIFS